MYARKRSPSAAPSSVKRETTAQLYARDKGQMLLAHTRVGNGRVIPCGACCPLDPCATSAATANTKPNTPWASSRGSCRAIPTPPRQLPLLLGLSCQLRALDKRSRCSHQPPRHATPPARPLSRLSSLPHPLAPAGGPCLAG